MPTPTPSYIAGLFESCLTVLPLIRGSSDGYDGLRFALSNDSLQFFSLLQEHLDIPVYQPDTYRLTYHSVFGHTLMAAIAQRLIPLNTPFRGAYEAILSFVALKASHSSYPPEQYAVMVQEHLARTIREIREPNKPLSLDASYAAGLIEGENAIHADTRLGRDFSMKVAGASLTARYLGIPPARGSIRLNARYKAALQSLLPYSVIRPDYLPYALSLRSRRIREEDRLSVVLAALISPPFTKMPVFTDKAESVRLNQERANANLEAEAAKIAKRARKQAMLKEEKDEVLARASHRALVKETNLRLLPQGKKMCVKCSNQSPLEHFYVCSSSVDGRDRYCKACVIKDHIEPHREKISARALAYLKANPGKAAEHRQRNAAKSAPFKLRYSANRRLKQYLTEDLEGVPCEQWFNCSADQLRSHLEASWQPGMTWINRGVREGWQVDHVVPFTVFEHNNPLHRKWCWDYRNLRPLWARDNNRKSDHLYGISVRRYRSSKRLDEMHQAVGTELERLGITTKTEYLASLTPPPQRRPITESP